MGGDEADRSFKAGLCVNKENGMGNGSVCVSATVQCRQCSGWLPSRLPSRPGPNPVDPVGAALARRRAFYTVIQNAGQNTAPRLLTFGQL